MKIISPGFGGIFDTKKTSKDVLAFGARGGFCFLVLTCNILEGWLWRRGMRVNLIYRSKYNLIKTRLGKKSDIKGGVVILRLTTPPSRNRGKPVKRKIDFKRRGYLTLETNQLFA